MERWLSMGQGRVGATCHRQGRGGKAGDRNTVFPRLGPVGPEQSRGTMAWQMRGIVISTPCRGLSRQNWIDGRETCGGSKQ
jgi:hypothetical protein